MKISIWLVFAEYVFGCVIVAGAQTQTAKNTPDNKIEGNPSRTMVNREVDRSSSKGTDYRIGPQDVLRVDVWRDEQLTRTVPVRPDGKITLPLLDDVQAAGLTPLELAGVIRDGLKKFINSPQVTVSVTEINSRRVYVTGEVLHAGALTLLPDMTVLQALSSAGGFTQFAKVKGVYVLRTENGKQTRYPFNYKEAITGRKLEQNIQLQPGDVIVVP